MHIKRDRLRRRRTHQKPKTKKLAAEGESQNPPTPNAQDAGMARNKWGSVRGDFQVASTGELRRRAPRFRVRAAGTSRSANEIAGDD